MIKIIDIRKTFSDKKFVALDNVNSTIQSGTIYGLIGSNGSGKSTLFKILAGVLMPDTGTVLLDNRPIFEDPEVKKEIVFLSDDQFFLPHSTMDDMKALYKAVYPKFDEEKFKNMTDVFKLSPKRKINTFSKGMKKQASIILGLSCRPKYLLCDETFDGLDPVMRHLTKKLLAEAVVEDGLTPIIASHNLRELEDIADHIGLIHKGGILFESEIDTLKLNIHTVQAVFNTEISAADFKDLNIVRMEKRGSMATIVARAEKSELEAYFRNKNATFFEIIPLTLEEIFIAEMEERGYDYTKLVTKQQ